MVLRCVSRRGAAVAALLVALTARPGGARAQAAADDPWDVSVAEVGAVAGLSLAAAWGLSRIPVREARWSQQLLPWDEGVKDNFNGAAATLADGTLAAAIALPVAIALGDELDERDGERMLLYGEAMVVNVLLVTGAKYLVQRPRPYTYSENPVVRADAAEQGQDAYLSFFSGHSSAAFTAAVAGSYLYGAKTDDRAARAAVWGANLGLPPRRRCRSACRPARAGWP